MLSTSNTKKAFLLLMATDIAQAESDSRNYTPIVGVIALCAMFGLVTVCICCCKGLFTSTGRNEQAVDRDEQAVGADESLLANSTASGS